MNITRTHRIFILFLFISANLFAAVPKIVEFKGTGSINRSGNILPLQANQTLNLFDYIHTDELSTVLIDLGDSAQLRISPKSVVQLKNLTNNSDDDEEEVGIFLQIGSLIIDVISDQFPGTLKIQNNQTAFAIRGTKFFTANEDNEVWAAVEHGDVEVTHSEGQDILSNDEGMVIEANQEVTEPKNYQWAKTIDWNGSNNDSFRKNRQLRRNEFKEKRARWKSNPQRQQRLQRFISRWKEKKQSRRQRMEGKNRFRDGNTRPIRRERNR